VVSGALRVCLSSFRTAGEDFYSKSLPLLFELRLPEYLRLLRYIDASLAFSNTTLREAYIQSCPSPGSFDSPEPEALVQEHKSYTNQRNEKNGKKTERLERPEIFTHDEDFLIHTSLQPESRPEMLPVLPPKEPLSRPKVVTDENARRCDIEMGNTVTREDQNAKLLYMFSVFGE
jgi:hypothetical protein